MKTPRLVFILLLMSVFVSAQETPDSLKLWKKGGVITLNFSQVSLTNWAAGGESSAAGEFLLNVFANYQKDKLSWDNTADFHYGFLKEQDNSPVKSNDKIDLSSKLGIKAGEKWNYAAMANFKSQFAPGYNYPDTDTPISKFLAPGYFNFALGMDYKTEKVSLLLSPTTAKITVVNDNDLSALGAFGVDPGKKSRTEIGAFIKFEGKADLVKNVTLQTKLDLFSNYFENPQNVDVDWHVLINMKVNDYLSANLITHLIYDDDIKIADKNGNLAPRVQFMETFGAGLTVKF